MTANTKPTVILFGEVLMDVFPDRTMLGGAPFNAACHLRAFGADPVLVTRTGTDSFRDRIIQVMEDKGMDTIGVQTDPRHATGQVAVHLRKDGSHRFEILDYQAYDFIDPIMARLIGLNVQPRLMYYGTLAQRHEISRRALSSLLESAYTPRMVDLNLRKPWYDMQTIKRSLERADIAKMNNIELATLAKTLRIHAQDEKQQAVELVKTFKLECLLVTSGEAGAWLVDKHGQLTSSPPSSLSAEDIKDTVGAGDAFSAVFIMGRLFNWPVAQTLERAGAFAAAICRIRGAVPENPEFYAEFMQQWNLAAAIQ